MNASPRGDPDRQGPGQREVFTDSDAKKENKDKTKTESPPSLFNQETRKIEESIENMQANAMLCKKR